MVPSVRLADLLQPTVLVLTILASCQAIPGHLGSTAEYFTPSARIVFDSGDDEDDEVDLYRDGSLGASVDFLAVSWPYLVRESSLSEANRGALSAEEEKLRALEGDRHKAEQERQVQKERVEALRLREEEAKREPNLAGDRSERTEAREKAESTLLQVMESAAAVRQSEAEQRAKVEDLKASVQRTNGTRLDGDWIVGPRLSIGIAGPAGDSEDGTEDASGAPVLYLGASLFADFYKGDRKPNSNDGVGVRLEFGYLEGITSDEDFADAEDGAWFVGLTVFL